MIEKTTPRSTPRRNRLISVMALAAALIVPAALLASPPGGGRGLGDGPGGCAVPGDRADAPRAMRMLRGLDLEPAQREAIMQLFEDSRAGLDGSREAARAIRDEIRAAAHAEPLDESAIRDASARLAVIEADLAIGRARTMQLVREQLNDEQRAELDQRIAQRGERRERRSDSSRRHRRGPAEGRGEI